MQKQTLFFLFNNKLTEVLLVYKTRGSFKNLLNGLGGFAQSAESMTDCAYRKLKEETGISTELYKAGTINRRFYKLGVFCGVIDKEQIKAHKAAEPLHWCTVESITNGTQAFLAPDVSYFVAVCAKRIAEERSEVL